VLSPDDPVGLATRAVLRFHAAAFTHEEPLARAGAVEPIHQLRVATRRLRAALRLFGPTLPAAAVAHAEGELAWMAGVIGAVRDLDVLAVTVARRARRVEPTLRDAIAGIETEIRRQRTAAQDVLTAALDAPRCRKLLVQLDGIASGPARSRRGVPLGEIAPALLAPLLRAVRDAGRRIESKPSAARLHRLRVRAKRLRYALETLRGLGGKRVVAAVAELTALQEVLGDHQDAATAIDWLREHATASGEPATLLAAGALVQILGRRARKLRRRAPHAWAGVERRVLRQELLRGRGGDARPLLRVAHA
jgi:CHAD domain-containing protein